MKKIWYICIIAYCLGLFLPGEALCLPAEEYARGEITERVVCQNDASQSYALYLPSSYTPKKGWPIIYAFDPGARGRLPLEHFRSAAEKFGYIIVGSNNSENGNPAATAAAARAMWDDTHQRLSINDSRIYTAGFSGGARVAIRIGLALNEKIAGVIACGAGFTSVLNPSTAIRFAFFGAAGIADFNLPELRGSEAKLETLGVPHRVETFEGAHEWLPSDLCVQALEWMELQSMKTGSREKDPAVIEEIYKGSVERAAQYEATEKIYLAYSSYKQIINDFKALKDVTELEKRAARLKDSKEVKQELSQEKDLDQQQTGYFAKMASLRLRILNSQRENSSDPYGGTATNNEAKQSPLMELQGIIADLKKKRQSKEYTFNNILARRVLSLYFISTYETASALLREQKYDQAAASFALDAELLPDNPQAHFNLACAYSQAGNKKKALAALKEAVKRGYNNPSEIDSNKALDGIRNEEEFKKIIGEKTTKTQRSD